MADQAAQPNTLTDAEKAAGWRLLFDGKTARGWVGFKKDAMPDGWQVREGCLQRVDTAGDIATTDTFADFDLSIDWKISPGGNSGIFFRVTDAGDAVWQTGPEQQIIDNHPVTGHRDGKNPLTMVGSLYALVAPKDGKDWSRPAGQWNTARIRAEGNRVAYWLNGTKTLEFEIGSAAFNDLVAKSKFVKFPGFAKARAGRIALQDHGDPVWFRNIKIRVIR